MNKLIVFLLLTLFSISSHATLLENGNVFNCAQGSSIQDTLVEAMDQAKWELTHQVCGEPELRLINTDTSPSKQIHEYDEITTIEYNVCFTAEYISGC